MLGHVASTAQWSNSFDQSWNPDGEGIKLNMSTGYAAATAWDEQPGAPRAGGVPGSTAGYLRSGIGGLPSSFTYYIIYHDDVDVMYVYVQVTSDLWQHFAFGTLDKEGTWVGGHFFVGYRASLYNSGAAVGFYPQTYDYYTVGALYVGGPTGTGWDGVPAAWAIPSYDGWANDNVRYHVHGSFTPYEGSYGTEGTATMTNSVDYLPHLRREYVSHEGPLVLGSKWANTQSAFFWPYSLYVKKPTNTALATLAGHFPHAWVTGAGEYINPGETITIGGTNYKAFPFRTVNNTLRDGSLSPYDFCWMIEI